jgi:hypothetical protein
MIISWLTRAQHERTTSWLGWNILLWISKDLLIFTLTSDQLRSGYPKDLRSQPQVTWPSRGLVMAHWQTNRSGWVKPSSLQIRPNLPICGLQPHMRLPDACLGGHWGPPPPARKTATPTGLVQEDRQPLPRIVADRQPLPRIVGDRQPLPRIVEKTVSLYPAS